MTATRRKASPKLSREAAQRHKTAVADNQATAARIVLDELRVTDVHPETKNLG